VIWMAVTSTYSVKVFLSVLKCVFIQTTYWKVDSLLKINVILFCCLGL